MVDVNTSGTLTYSNFSLGLNYRDDQNTLPIGETPFAQNFEIVPETGLKKINGWEERFNFQGQFNWRGACDYWDVNNNHYYLAVSYPDIVLIAPDTGNFTVIDSTLNSTGVPCFIPCSRGRMMIVDGYNPPRLVDGTTVTVATWPFTYVAQNSSSGGKLDASNLAVEANPATEGYPSFGVYFTNRIWLAGDALYPNRIYVTPIEQLTTFGDNTASNFDIAFFVDLPTNSPITQMKVISNEFLVVYCEREIILISGKFPPGTAFPEPYYDADVLNPQLGALGFKLVQSRSNNDHFYVGNDGVVGQMSLTQNFQDVKPVGLSEKIYPALQPLNNSTFQRGLVHNNKIKGELQLWIPDETYHRQINNCYIYNYTDQPNVVAWSLITDWGDNIIRDVFTDSENNEQIIVTPDAFLTANVGNNFNGEPINMVYQLATLDFGAPDNKKQIIEVTMYALTTTGAKVNMYHLWDDGQTGFTQFEFSAQNVSQYGTATYGTSRWSARAGQPFQSDQKKMPNPTGKILKCRVEHSSADEDLIIKQIVFRYTVQGK